MIPEGLIFERQEETCQTCKSHKFYVEYKGNNIGLYCANCHKYVKWISKAEAKRIEATILNSAELQPKSPFDKMSDNDIIANGLRYFIEEQTKWRREVLMHADLDEKYELDQITISTLENIDFNISRATALLDK